jgi:hypothetical protein
MQGEHQNVPMQESKGDHSSDQFQTLGFVLPVFESLLVIV